MLELRVPIERADIKGIEPEGWLEAMHELLRSSGSKPDVLVPVPLSQHKVASLLLQTDAAPDETFSVSARADAVTLSTRAYDETDGELPYKLLVIAHIQSTDVCLSFDLDDFDLEYSAAVVSLREYNLLDRA